MSTASSVRRIANMTCRSQNRAIGLVMFMIAMPSVGYGEILWSGDYESGNFLQWHLVADKTKEGFSQMPAYGRPLPPSPMLSTNSLSYYGNGSALALVTAPVRQGKYAAKFTVMNSKNAVGEPDDCDAGGSVCTRRRSELSGEVLIPKYYNALPYLAERWISVSHFVPLDWDDSGSGFGPLVFQVKQLNGGGGAGPTVSIQIREGAWYVDHRWSEVENPTSADVPWQQIMFYAGSNDGKPYPRSDFWPEGLRDYPDVDASQAALKNLNKGGWTDWVIHTRIDARGSGKGGQGFLTIWKRANSGPWVKVLHILPKRTTRGGMTFDHGIGYNAPANGTNPGGFGLRAGIYMGKNQVWGLPANRVIYNDNIKIGSASATFSQMSPDGSSPGSAQESAEKPPKPPVISIDP